MRQMMQASLRATLLAAGLGCALLLSPTVQAAGHAAPQSQYQRDVEHCNTTPGIDKQACLKEAGAAAQAAKDSGLTNPSPQSEAANRTQRCDSLKGSQRQDCMTLMDSANTRVEGSVQGGGILRETTITVPAAGMHS